MFNPTTNPYAQYYWETLRSHRCDALDLAELR
jgi:hypothetical protein